MMFYIYVRLCLLLSFILQTSQCSEWPKDDIAFSSFSYSIYEGNTQITFSPLIPIGMGGFGGRVSTTGWSQIAEIGNNTIQHSVPKITLHFRTKVPRSNKCTKQNRKSARHHWQRLVTDRTDWRQYNLTLSVSLVLKRNGVLQK